VAAVLSTSPPDSVHLAAAPLARRFGLPWIADFRDPWVGLHYHRPPTPWHLARQRALERRVLLGADLVLAVTRTHARALEQDAQARPRRVVHLPNGFEPDTSPPGPSQPDSRALHAGLHRHALADARRGDPVRGAATSCSRAALRRARRIRVRFAGPFEAEYEDRAVALGLTGIVTWSGPIAYAEARALQRRADLLMLWTPGGYHDCVPGKVYDYLDSGRPLLALLEPEDELTDLVLRGGGTRLAPGDREGLSAEIERRYLVWKEAGGAPATGQRPEWLEEYTRSSLAARLAALLDGMATRAGTAAGEEEPR